MEKNSIIIFTRQWLNDFFLKIIEKSELFKNLKKIVITEFIKDAKKYNWELLNPLKENIYDCKTEFSVEELIKRDRLLRNINKKTALKMVANCYKQIKEIISRERPKFAFTSGAINYTTDLFIKICELYNVTVLPFTGFFINKRFRFTKYGEPIFINKENDNLDLFEYFKNKNIPLQNKNLKKLTFRRRITNNLIKAELARFKLKYLNWKDYNNNNFFIRSQFHKYTAMPRFFLKDLFIKNYFKQDLSDIKFSKPVIYISMHVIPEASIDYWGSIDMMNHDEIILELLENYNNDYQFIIKEHPSMFGSRNLSFYDKVRKIKNVVLLTPYYDRYKILEKADIVLTWSGSIGVESLFYNKKCLNMIKPYYYIDGFTTYPKNRFQLFSNFNKIIENLKVPNNKTKIAMNKLLADISAPGVYNNRALDDDNINKLARASELLVKDIDN